MTVMDSMSDSWTEGLSGTVKDALDFIGERQVPVVQEDAQVSDIIRCFADSSYSRVIYVTSLDGALLGAITQQELVKHVFIHFHDEYMDKRSLLSQAVSETAEDFMHNERLHCRMEDDLGELLTEMITFNQDEVPVVDSSNKLINDITMMDIIRFSAAKGLSV